MPEFYIIKSTGERQRFNLKKFRRSLRKCGAKPDLIEKIVDDVKKMRPKSTKQIREYALAQLTKISPPLAARYNLKTALMEMGPAGFPFEKFIAELFKRRGYKTSLNKTVDGFCTDHEIDVIAEKGKKHCMIECKFHARHGHKTNIKVALYIKARFDDIQKIWEKEHIQHDLHDAWIATNTQFTSKAITYGKCVGIQMLGWNYPKKNNLPYLVDTLGLHPITALTTLSKYQKREFIKKGFVLCEQTAQYRELLKRLGFSNQKINRLIDETNAVCKLPE